MSATSREPGLLTPGQILLAQQLAMAGVSNATSMAQMLGVPLDRVQRSFRLPAAADVAYLTEIGRVPMSAAPEGEV